MSEKSYIFRIEYEIELNIKLHFPEIDGRGKKYFYRKSKLLRFNDLIMSKLK